MSETPNFLGLAKLPEIGVIPRTMLAQVIRESRFGQPTVAFQEEIVPTPQPGPGEVLVCVMAAGINYNNVWAAL